jgi:hypothetical protein
VSYRYEDLCVYAFPNIKFADEDESLYMITMQNTEAREGVWRCVPTCWFQAVPQIGHTAFLWS